VIGVGVNANRELEVWFYYPSLPPSLSVCSKLIFLQHYNYLCVGGKLTAVTLCEPCIYEIFFSFHESNLIFFLKREF
jgi:hypothetical protein